MSAIESMDGPGDGGGDAQTLASDMRIGLIGYGEVGRIFAGALVANGVHSVVAYDVKRDDVRWRAEADARAARDGVVLAATTHEAVAAAHLVIVAVTAAAAMGAGEQVASTCPANAFVLDVNSASPRTKTVCAGLVAAAGGRYVEAAVMTSVPPYGLRVPMLLGGPHAAALAPLLATFGFDARVGAADYGVVSAIKLSRSVVIKGMEALFVESLVTARRYGVEREVLASLVETFPGIDWEQQATYFWRRVVQHGRRRAEEMREAAGAVRDAGATPRMASATADVQAWIAELAAAGVFSRARAEDGWRGFVDAIERDADGPA